MRRWRKKEDEDEDEVLTFDNIDEDEDEDEERSRRRYKIPRSPIRTRFSSVDESDEDDSNTEDGPSSFERLEPLIRSGKYKPKPSDHYTVHILYQTLRDLGEI